MAPPSAEPTKGTPVAKIAKQTVRLSGSRNMVYKGRSYEDDADVVKNNPWLFVDPDDAALSGPKSTADLGHRAMSNRRTVEQATAAPGEQRDVTYECDVDGCDFTSTSERGVSSHKGQVHK